MASEIFQEVYPFTTESINGYFNKIDFNDKSVLTVGSSSDQAFNAILLGAKNITVYDINKNTSFFGKLKRQIIIDKRMLYNGNCSTYTMFGCGVFYGPHSNIIHIWKT